MVDVLLFWRLLSVPIVMFAIVFLDHVTSPKKTTELSALEDRSCFYLSGGAHSRKKRIAWPSCMVMQ